MGTSFFRQVANLSGFGKFSACGGQNPPNLRKIRINHRNWYQKPWILLFPFLFCVFLLLFVVFSLFFTASNQNFLRFYLANLSGFWDFFQTPKCDFWRTCQNPWLDANERDKTEKKFLYCQIFVENTWKMVGRVTQTCSFRKNRSRWQILSLSGAFFDFGAKKSLENSMLKKNTTSKK